MGPHHGPSKDCNGSAMKKENVVRYKECRKNHAASIGGYAVDGCREFMASGEAGTAQALICAACTCHRSFHKREVEVDDCSSNSTSPRSAPAQEQNCKPDTSPGSSQSLDNVAGADISEVAKSKPCGQNREVGTRKGHETDSRTVEQMSYHGGF